MDVNAIEQAIAEFYHTADGRQKAHTWLSSIQGSPDAWQFSWTLISENKSQEVQFFGATTLQNKILKYWFEVPQESIPHLRSQLLEKILVFGASPSGKLIANKLCLAMSAFIIHTVTDEWTEAVSELTSTFQSMDRLSDETRCRLLLEVLTGIAEQYPHANLGVKSGRRAAVHCKLMKDFDHIYQLLSSLLEQNVPITMKEGALRCISSWVDFGVMLDKLDALVCKAFNCLYDHNLFETAVDTLIAALTKNEPYKFPATMQKYFIEIFKLASLWETAIAEENMEWCRDISRLVINFAEENATLLLRFVTGTEEQQRLAMGIVNMILVLTDVKGTFPVDENLSDLSFGFWAILQDLVLAGTEEYFDHYMGIFTPVYITLTNILLRKVAYPEDSLYSGMSSEEKEQFRCYRQDIIDTVTYANCLLRDNLLMLLKTYVASVSNSLPNLRWQEVEGLLYILSNVTEDSLSADEEEWDVGPDGPIKTPNNLLDEILVDMVELLKKLNLENKVLLEAVLQVIGAFSEHYSQKPELLSIVFPVILLHGLSHPDTAMYATRALKDICKDNMSHIGTYSEGILNVCHHKLLEGSMVPRNAARLLSCVGHVLSSLQYEKIVEWLNKFLPPITRALTDAAASSQSMKIKMQIMDKLQMLTWLFDSLDVKKTEHLMKTSTHTQPVLIMMKDLLPVIQSILSNWVSDPDIIECIVELIKNSLHTLVDDFINILQDVCVLLMKIYECQQHASILDMMKQLVLMFAKDNITYELVKNTFHNISHKTVITLRPDAHSKTDLVESFMNLCSQMSKKAANILIDENFPFQQTLEICVIGISFPETPTMKACSQYISNVLSKKDKFKQLDQIIPVIAPQLYDILLKSIGGAAPRTNIEHTTGIFLAMNVAYFNVASSAMTVLLNQENYPAPQPNPDQKSRFIKDVLKERSNKRRLQETLVTFSMICRGIAGTEYALSTAQSLQYR